jgi:hypothetical protein
MRDPRALNVAAVGSRRHNTDIGALRVDQLFEQLCLTFESPFLLRTESDRDFAARQLRRIVYSFL